MTDQSTQSMNDSPAEEKKAAANKRPSRSSEFVAILSSAISLGVLLVAIASLMTILLTNQLTAIKQDLNSFEATAAADRRAFQAGMDEFRREILRLTDRQARLEGMQEAQASATSTGS